jgi:hypothetical protein
MRPEQMEMFSLRKQERFIDELTEAAAEAYPEVVWMKGKEGLRRLIVRYVEEGKSFKLSYEYTLGRYTYWRLDHGDVVQTEPEWEFFRDILHDDTLSEEEKVFQIDTILNGAPLYPEAWDYE